MSWGVWTELCLITYVDGACLLWYGTYFGGDPGGWLYELMIPGSLLYTTHLTKGDVLSTYIWTLTSGLRKQHRPRECGSFIPIRCGVSYLLDA